MVDLLKSNYRQDISMVVVTEQTLVQYPAVKFNF